MGKRLLTSAQIDVLRTRGNPYAFIDDDDDELDNSKDVIPTVAQAQGKDAVDSKLSLSFTQQERAILRARGNQYAFIVNEDELVDPPQRESISVSDVAQVSAFDHSSTRRARISASKIEFERESRRILSHYMPKMEKGSLRPEHRAFISRNSGRSGAERFELLAGLRKYDLSGLGLRPLFNRERQSLTDEKLFELELSLQKAKSKK